MQDMAENNVDFATKIIKQAGVIATQRPSVNVITGLIKANIPSRIAFQARPTRESWSR